MGNYHVQIYCQVHWPHINLGREDVRLVKMFFPAQLRALFLGLVLFSKVKGEYGITNMVFKALNLNVTFMWDPLNIPPLENEVIYYTVIHEELDTDINVPGCINITTTVCNLVHHFSTENPFSMNEHFRVSFFSSARTDVKGETGMKTFNNHYVDISGPVIYKYVVNSRNVTVWVHGPWTPFTIDNNTLYIGNHDPIARKMYLGVLCFRSFLSILDQPKASEQSTETNIADNGKAVLVYTGLNPHTRYTLRVGSKLGFFSEFEPDAETTFEFRTKQEAPDLGPIITHYKETRRSCDMRDIRLTWKENKGLRDNVEISHYVITCENKESGEKKQVKVTSAYQSTRIFDVYRWAEQVVTLRSVNSAGTASSEIYNIPPDDEYPETYRITKMAISKESAMRWRLTWDPPSHNMECIVGYNISTFYDGILEETHALKDTLSTTLSFQRVGRYIVDIVPVVNNSVGTTKVSTMEYTTAGLKWRQWTILASVLILVCLTLSAVIALSRKVCCDASGLPDFTKSLSVRLAANRSVFVHSLKSPPEKELFHAPRNSHTSIVVTTQYDEDVFEPKSTSSSQLINSKTPSKCKDEIAATEVNESREKANTDSTYLKFSVNRPQQKTDTSDAPAAVTRSSIGSHPDGYVSHSLSVKASLTVYIPREEHSMKPGSLSPQSTSSDSGISSSAYTGSLSDYVPPSPFSDIDSAHDTSRDSWNAYDVKSRFPYVKHGVRENTCYGNDFDGQSPYIKEDTGCQSDSYGYNCSKDSPYVKSSAVQNNESGFYGKEDSPYVKSGVAGQPGRIISTSDPLQSPGTKSSNQPDVQFKGYLPMTSSVTHIDGYDQYAKLSSKS
ncbi:uncharacterized protein [Apostichopus japonicus]|uniref:uncharacterized protein isoform X2 n=1 Tax=Stichopus japonicus TaxID=307972 RepID=UPI003AB720B8